MHLLVGELDQFEGLINRLVKFPFVDRVSTRNDRRDIWIFIEQVRYLLSHARPVRRLHFVETIEQEEKLSLLESPFKKAAGIWKSLRSKTPSSSSIKAFRNRKRTSSKRSQDSELVVRSRLA